MSSLGVTGSSIPLQSMNMAPIGAGQMIKSIIQNPDFLGVVVGTTTCVGLFIGLLVGIKVNEQAKHFSKETQNLKFFKPSLVTLSILAGLVPVIGVRMATMKFLFPIPLSPRSAFIVASTTVITIATIAAGLIYYIQKESTRKL
jgi:hypothetical protein